MAVASGAFLVLTSGAVERGGTGMVPDIPALRMLFLRMRHVYQLLFKLAIRRLWIASGAKRCHAMMRLRCMIDRDEESQGVIQSLSMPVVLQPRHRDHFSRTLHVSCNTSALEAENEGELA
jgi:hypothetical protein